MPDMPEMEQIIQLPFSAEAEQALLGALLLEPDLLSTIDITPTDFYLVRHADIFRAMDSIKRQGQPVDYVTVCASLKDAGKLDLAGGGSYIIGLLSATITSAHAEEYARIVHEKARRRGMLEIANRMAKTAYDESENLDAALPVFIEAMANSASIRGGAVPVADILSRLFDEVQTRYANPVDTWGIATGFRGYDRLTGGMQPTELTLISGIPGIGKSIMAMQMGAQMGEVAPGVIYSMEMGSLQVMRRLVSGKAAIQTRSLKTGNITQGEWRSFTEAIAHLEKLPVYISDSSGWTTTSLRADMAKLKATHKIQWFILDYLYLLNDGAGSDEIERTSLASKGLKRAAKELDLAGVAVHSMNKAGMSDKGIPSQEMLRGSGQVIYDADVITFLTRYDRQYDPKSFGVQRSEEENLRMLWFGKGRELESHAKVIKFVKSPGFPAFREVYEEATK
jgi:replicative DNA helicase